MKEKRILHLTLHRRYFDQIAIGVKKNEYRDMTPYWTKRLLGKVYDEVHFRNGYSIDRPFMRVQWLGIQSDITNRRFVTGLGEVLEIKNWSFKKVD